ncbi:group II intron maturase-specific domain-containing protein, partial [Candidatus Mycobacterium methanotrophicum]
MISRQVSTSQPIDELLRRLNVTLRGWAGHFRAGVSSAVFSYLNHCVWHTVWRWIRRKHPKSTWKQLRRQYCGGRWWPAGREMTLIDLSKDRHDPIPLPRIGHPNALAAHRRRGTPRRRDGSCGEPGALRDARRVREAARRNGTAARLSPRSGPT